MTLLMVRCQMTVVSLYISSDEFEEENDNDVDDSDGSSNLNNAIDKSSSPPTPKNLRLL